MDLGASRIAGQRKKEKRQGTAALQNLAESRRPGQGQRQTVRLSPAAFLDVEIACSTPSTTVSTVMPVIHRKSIGQVRRKQGEQRASDLSNRWRGSPGKPG